MAYSVLRPVLVIFDSCDTPVKIRFIERYNINYHVKELQCGQTVITKIEHTLRLEEEHF